MASADPLVDEEWNCDKGRWAFTYTGVGDRRRVPDGARRRRRAARRLVARGARARGAADLRGATRAGVLVGGRVSAEDAYACGKLARRPCSARRRRLPGPPALAEEAEFLASSVVGTGPGAAP